MGKYVVVTWPNSQELMDKEGFAENSYLVNDEQGLEDFGSSAYFVDEEWLDSVEDSDNQTTETSEERFVSDVIAQCQQSYEDGEDYTFDVPYKTSDGWTAKGFYQDDENEDVRIVCEDCDGRVEHLFLSEMPIEDAYELAKRIDDVEYHYE
jgi:hypothetical protein